MVQRPRPVPGFDDIAGRLWTTIRENWYLGFTSFGGPPVHFKIFHDKYVKKLKWIDDQMYQELFSVCQSLSGPASTKMHYCVNLLHDGFIPAVLGFLLWSLPGAIGMYALGLGVSNIGESLPRAVYALLSGLNAATVGIVALAAVQLSEKAATDTLTRLLVLFGACAGMLYNALWYFPVLMAFAGIVAIVWDARWVHRPVNKVVTFGKEKLAGRRSREDVGEAGVEEGQGGIQAGDDGQADDGTNRPSADARGQNEETTTSSSADTEPRVVPAGRRLAVTWKSGLAIVIAFFLSFAAIMALRGALPRPTPRLFALFANMYLAGTIIFGGGPVVIPLLREYIVAEGWVPARDFLLGLAIIQAFPGPNFNFAVYLGALTAANAGQHSVAGAVVGWLGIFAPGLILVHGTMGIWNAIRGWRWVRSVVRGLNASAVGLIYTAVYRLWQIGYIDEGYEQGTSLALEPWWVVVTATSFVGGYWFNVSPPVAILMGAVMGMIWYGVVTT
ncbi:hypothetical protein SODALDRAFT_12670 [Sodiomyces alkalinus F11]|uniref:Chromate ion transporter n=1 Tax=Sodiomyces alkalinus (strain CBS 110278 / VKM F-3762 / F11) TaxID=1314773 RepID=A0A3N2Q6D5_SODAK|nr:hypothetical protein SODALDRAFT_12670 [Sodiomyces alkalinus F11]ROT42331.1 hypothetical protein SODALDRAFT_12670 [Sodiomyces alkalinus F11]